MGAIPFLAAFCLFCFISEYLECESVVAFIHSNSLLANFDENATWSLGMRMSRKILQDAFYNNLIDFSV